MRNLARWEEVETLAPESGALGGGHQLQIVEGPDLR
jgi:hypothetical protein